jgi:TolA-binding protein
MADNAQYWIGECLAAKKQYSEAIAELDKVGVLFPKGDKVPTARYKKAMILKDNTDQPDLAMVEFQAIIKLFPRSNEATLAKQQMGSR